MRRTTLVAVPLLLLSVASCGSFGIEDAEETFVVASVPFADFHDVEGLTRGNPGVDVLRDQAELDRFFFDHSPVLEPVTAPSFDFDARMLLAVFWGTEHTGCANRVEAIEEVLLRTYFDETPQQLEVRVGPLPDLGACDAVVFPIQIIEVDRNEQPVLFGGDVPS